MRRFLSRNVGIFLNIYIIITGLILAGCAADRDLDDYKREKARNDRLKADSISGIYTGLLISLKDQAELGPVGLKLGTTSLPSNFNESRPVLTGELLFLGSSSIPINFTQGFYEPLDGSFQLAIPIGSNQATGEIRVLSLEGKVVGDLLKGRLGIVGGSQEGAAVELTRRPETQSVQGYFTNESVPASSVDKTIHVYEGYAQTSQRTYSASLKIRTDVLRPELRFSNLFLRRKLVQVDLTLQAPEMDTGSIQHQIPPYSFVNAEWDQETGMIEGLKAGTAMRERNEKINCSPKNPLFPKDALDCTLLISNLRTVEIKISLEMVL
jgi:hypothetical protein